MTVGRQQTIPAGRCLTDVNDGTELVSRASDKLATILSSVKVNASLLDEISDASSNQAEAIGEITVAVRQLDEMTQHNAALVEQINGAIHQTESQAADLDAAVARFTISEGAREPKAAVRRAA